MELTDAQRHLTAGLRMHGVSLGPAMAVCLMLREENRQMEMIEFLLSKETVTDEEALDMARRLTEEE